MFLILKKYSHRLFLYIQKNISTISGVRFLVKLFDKRIDMILGLLVMIWLFYKTILIPNTTLIPAILGFLLLFIITTLIKYIVHEPRPFVTYAHLYDSPNHFGKNDSFPSNHTVYFFGLATMTTLLLGYIIWPLYVLAVFIGITRVIGGVHYPHDVIAGVLFGTVGVWVMTVLVKNILIIV